MANVKKLIESGELEFSLNGYDYQFWKESGVLVLVDKYSDFYFHNTVFTYIFKDNENVGYEAYGGFCDNKFYFKIIYNGNVPDYGYKIKINHDILNDYIKIVKERENLDKEIGTTIKTKKVSKI